MTMSSSSSASPYRSSRVEELPAVTSGGSCSVLSNNNDVTSVGSNSTKTRFSFYNAEEVQMEEQNINTTTTTGNSNTNNNARNKDDKNKPVDGDKAANASTNSVLNSIGSSGSSSNEHQRFNFYIAGETGVGKIEDDRRSPHTLLVTEDNDNKRTPAVTSNTTTALSTSETIQKPTSRSTSAGKAITPAAGTPQRSNSSSLTSSAQKKKQRAVQAAAARARNHSNKSDKDTPTRKQPAGSSSHQEATQEEQHSNMDSVEILRSLKDTEQMRYNLMKECHPDTSSTNNKQLHQAASGSSHDTSSQDSPPEVFQDAAETLPNEHLHQPLMTTTARGTTRSDYHPDFHNSLQRPATTVMQTTNGNLPPSFAATTTTCAPMNSKQPNPYEDAIREALDLLRRHRPPSPGQHQLAPTTTNNNSNTTDPEQQPSALAIDMNVVNNTKTPRDADRVLQSRWESPLQNQEEFDSRRKERQERMARYTSRLAELKNGEEPLTMLNRPASTIEEEEDGSMLSSLPSNSMDQHQLLAASSSFQSQQQRIMASSSLSPHQAPALSMSMSNGGGIPSTCPSGDLASSASSLSASHYNPQQQGANNPNNPKEVHRSVERVLLAILERAHSNGRGVQLQQSATIETAASHGSHYSSSSSGSNNHHHHPRTTAQPDISSWQGEEKKSPSADQLFLAPSSSSQQPLQPVGSEAEDPLLRAVGELLSSSGGGGGASVVSMGSQQQQQEPPSTVRPPTDSYSSHRTHSHTNSNSTNDQISLASGAKRSVVEELLAEAESFGEQQQQQKQPHVQQPQSVADNQHQSSDGHSGNESNKRAEDLLNCSTGVEAVRSDQGADASEVDRELDDLVLKTLGKSTAPAEKEEPARDDDDQADEEEDYEEEDSHSRSPSDSYDGGDDNDDSYDDDEGDDESDDDLDDALEGVLGPLSKKAGGTTGVVLESNLSPDRSSGERSIFDSLSNAMTLVASAISGDEKAAALHLQQHSSKSSSGRDKYATDLDLDTDEHDEDDDDDEDEDDVESIDQSASSDEEVDEEAGELMRSLCAHLLPFGVDQSNRFLDEVPHWDDSNPNEAGYRIIRLTNQQLQRVERAFSGMVHGLKKNSEQNLIASSQPEGGNGEVDDTFERDLAVAEKALDREEENRTTAIMKTLKLGTQKDGNGTVPAPNPTISESDGESDAEGISGKGISSAGDCHPIFPGVHSAGKGEMGDLEYFHLPVIFKSHVTGFEPTKDLFLEPGNVVAGQYLVESELGSAAFSTAYRCVDLNSEGDDTEDGHQEVCLKVIKNTKDFFDQSLDEIKILELLRQTGKCHQNHIIEMKTFFYHREHLIIVTELLRQNLFEFGKFILDHDEEPYFTLPRLGFITRQCMIALRFVHNLGLVHSDVKPENILLGSYSRAQVKLIDFGSSCYLTDRQSSYIQSRSYRAPEVVLGLPYDGKIDVWSLGCVVAEMLTGEVTFQNDSIVSMLSRIEAICGPFPRHMIAQGRQSCRFFTKCGLLFEKVKGEDGQKTPDASEDEDEEDDSDIGGRGGRAVFDIFQPKVTSLGSRLGFAADLHERYVSGATLSATEERQAQFVDFVKKLLTIDPDSRPSASEALKHPWMLYAATLTEENIKYPSS